MEFLGGFLIGVAVVVIIVLVVAAKYFGGDMFNK